MNIEKHLNVLNKKEQLSILKLVDKKLTKIFRGSGLSHPGLQTYSDLHHYEELQPLVKNLKKYIPGNFTIKKCWANHTDGGYVSWHKHPTDLSVVYYLKNKESIGTFFKIDGKEVPSESPENSLIIFKGDEVHSVPPRKKGTLEIDRYSIAFDIDKERGANV